MNLNEDGYPKIRKLTRKDRKTLSLLIKNFANRSGNEKLTEMIPKTNNSDNENKEKENSEELYSLIKTVLESVIEWVEEDVTQWFMDLVGAENREEYDNLPVDIEIHIIDQLIAERGFNNFFSRVSDLYKKIRD